jgi:glucosylceramidase
MKRLFALLILPAVMFISCKTVQKPGSTGNVSRVTVYTTALNTEHRITKTGETGFSDFGQPLETQPCIFVDPSKTFQTFLGIGGAITDASAETFSKLPKARQQELIRAYYDPVNGIGYSIVRTNIHSCDFSSGSYTYVQENDQSLSTFNIDHDRKFRIPMIKEAIAAAGGKLNLYVSPWSPPSWMKDNKNMLQGGKLLPEFRQSWANYYVKYINEYEKEGIPVWGLSVQNEPFRMNLWQNRNGNPAFSLRKRSGISSNSFLDRHFRKQE